MNVRLRDGASAFESFKVSLLAQNIGYARYKKGLKNLVDNYSGRLDFVGSIFQPRYCIGISFQSPVHDGWLSENKPVADLLFPGYKFGQKHWDDKVEDIYPYLSLYIRTAEEKVEYAEALTSWSIDAPSPIFENPVYAEGSTYPGDIYYEVVQVFEPYSTQVYNEQTGQMETVVTQVHTKDTYTFYALNLEWLFLLPNQKFYDFISEQGRIYFNVDVAKRSWLQFVLPGIILIVIIVITILCWGGCTAGASTAAEGATASGSTAAAETAVADVGVSLAADGAATIGSAELSILGTNTIAGFIYDTVGTVGLQAIGAASYAYTAYSTLSSIDSLMKMFPPSYGSIVPSNMGSGRDGIKWGFDFDEPLSLPNFGLPTY